MKQLALFMAAFSALFFVFCKGSKKAAGGPTELVEIETWPCRGYCPAYKMTFLSDGKVAWEGLRAVRKMGKENFQLTKLETGDVKPRVDRAEISKFEKEYKSGIADAAGYRLSFWENGKKRTISVEGGSQPPAKLLGLETFLKELGEKYGYDTRKGFNPNEPDEATAQTVIVELKPEVNAGNWLAQFSELKLSLVRRLRPDVNIWLVKFDSAQLSANDLVAAFKTSPDVILAQPNHQAKDRH